MSSKKFVSLLLILAVFGVIAAGTAYGQKGAASLTVTGQIRDADGIPAADREYTLTATIEGASVPRYR